MKASKLGILGLLLISYPLVNVVNCFAQGIFLRKGTSGFGLAGGFSSAENVSGLSARVGWAVNGIFDIRFFVVGFL